MHKDDKTFLERFSYSLGKKDDRLFTLEKYYREDSYTIQEQNGNLTPYVDNLLKSDDLTFIDVLSLVHINPNSNLRDKF